MKAACRVIVIMLVLCMSRAYGQSDLPKQKEYEPPNGKGRVVIVLSGQSGPASYIPFAKELAKQGYYTALFDGNDFWLKGGGGEALLKGVIARAQQSPHALPGKVGVIGFSLGGGATLAYATRDPELVSAVVTMYPLTNWIKDPDAFVSRVKVPTILLAAARDTYKNCCLIEMARKLSTAAAKTPGGPATLEVIEYPDADHGFNLRDNKAWRSNDAADALRRALSHLRLYLGT
jgi:pimeloyl-ACP methyl ester carboxylesterase